jgi:transcriptional regulator with XRE-family HTH domain
MRGKKNKLSSSVGAVIAEKRKKKRWTQAQFAGIIGITQDSLSRMESGEIAPKFSRLQDIANALSCPVSDLFRFTTPDAIHKAERIADLIGVLPEQFQDVVMELLSNTVSAFRGMNNTKNHE